MIERRLADIADELDELNEQRQELYDERLRLWQAGQDRGLNPVALAQASRIKAVTVRTLLARAKTDNVRS